MMIEQETLMPPSCDLYYKTFALVICVSAR
jgi:hypothetical protein